MVKFCLQIVRYTHACAHHSNLDMPKIAVQSRYVHVCFKLFHQTSSVVKVTVTQMLTQASGSGQ